MMSSRQRVHVLSMTELEYDILSYLAQSEGPVGSGQLFLSLRDRYGLGQASIGRKLQEMDRAGYTRRLGYKGRVITPQGKKRLKELLQEVLKRANHQHFLECLDVSNLNRLLDVLAVRKVLEKEAARTAAMKATHEDLREIQRALEAQRASIATGDEETASREDAEFHDLVAKASKNEVLRRALRLVAGESGFSAYTSQMRARAGGSLGVDHFEIFERIRARDPAGAEAAMAAHIDSVMQDVVRFWNKEHSDVGACEKGELRG